MFGTKIAPQQFSTVHQYRVAKARQDELEKAFVKHNLAQSILHQRKYYTEGLRKFEKGDLVYFFTPQLVGEASKKLSHIGLGLGKF